MTNELDPNLAIAAAEEIIRESARANMATSIPRGPLRRLGDLVEQIADVPIGNFNPRTLQDEQDGFRIGNLIPPLGAAAMIRRAWREKQAAGKLHTS